MMTTHSDDSDEEDDKMLGFFCVEKSLLSFDFDKKSRILITAFHMVNVL